MSSKVITKTRTSTRTKVIVGVVAAGMAAAAGFGLITLRDRFAKPAPEPTLSPPTFTAARMPASPLVDGSNILHRFSITAPTADVFIKKLTFVANVNDPTLSLSSPALRDLGKGLRLGTEAAEFITSGGEHCGVVLSETDRCVSLVLSKPLVISEGRTITLEFLSDVAGVDPGDSIAT